MADRHVIPIDDAIPHDDTRGCWCQPTIELIDDGDALVVHHSADGRERTEPGAVYPPATRH